MSDFPFEEKIINETAEYVDCLRTFSGNLSFKELNWHRDRENRIVTVLEGSGWYIQFENKLPTELSVNSVTRINKNTWHRIINKNRNNLKLIVRKFKDE